MPTVREIAKQAGVANSTVSLVMNNKAGVSEKTRQLVLNAYNDLSSKEDNGTSLSKKASGLFSLENNDNKKPLTFVVYHPAILNSSQVFSDLLKGIQDAADLFHAQLRLAINEQKISSDHVSNLYLQDPKLQPDGILIIGAHEKEPILEEATRQKIPYVLVSRTTSDPSITAVGRDEVKITHEAVNYLIGLGHSSIGFVGGNPDFSYTNQRIKGYRQALIENGITPLDRWIAIGSGKKAAQSIIKNSPEITAVIMVNDSYAMEALEIFKNAGYKIPENLSIISFDDTDEAQNFNPPLTSIQNPRYEEGVWAVRMLVEKIRNPLMAGCQLILKSTLIIRDSCTRPNINKQAQVIKGGGTK